MLEPIEQYIDDGITVSLYPDYDCPSPIDPDWSDQAGTLYSEGGIGDRMAGYSCAAERIREARREGFTVLPLRFSDYGSAGARIWETDLDDANAYYQVSREEVAKEWGGNRRHARRYLRAVVTELDRYLQGDCYGYSVEAPEADFLDSCWGFIGEEYAREQMAEAVEDAREAVERERTERAAMAARGVETVGADE